jgi:hypothetical protein
VRDDEKRSIWTGLIALVAVGLVVGLLAGGATFFGARLLGLDDTSTASSSEGPGARLVMPSPEETEPPEGPLFTLPGGPPDEEESSEPSPSESESESEEPESEISLQAGSNQVSPGEQIDLTGVYPGGEGASLVVQRFENGGWVQFGTDPITATVTGETFSTYIITSQTGENRFRVLDTGNDEASNEVTVTIG